MLNQPVNQVRMTNVALIKYKLHNKKFEIACYKNKAINWRNGIEKDLDEVLQSDQIYTNASQGQIASEKELKKFFPNQTQKEIMKLILSNGELQISEKERDVNLDTIFKEIVNIIAEKCVHSISKRPISLDSVEKAVKDIHFPIRLDISSKRQALLCIKKLQRKFMISRAQMEVQITIIDSLHLENLKKELVEKKIYEETIDDLKLKVNEKGEISFRILIDPSNYRILDDLLKNQIKSGFVEVIMQYVVNKEVANIENTWIVNLEIRPDYKEGDELGSESDEEEEDEKKKKKKIKKGKDAIKKEATKKEEEKKNEKSEEKKEEMQSTSTKEITQNETGKKESKCSTCKASFENANEFRTHCKSPWHTGNLKRKNEKLEPLTEEEFATLEIDIECSSKKNKRK